MSSPTYTYEVGEHIWVESKGFQYEGKVKKRKFNTKKDRKEYLVKYKGYGDRNNQWVGEDKLVLHSQEVKAQAEERKRAAKEAAEDAERKPAKDAKETRSRSSSAASMTAKRSSNTSGRDSSEPLRMKLLKSNPEETGFTIETRQESDVTQDVFFKHLRLPPKLAEHVQACHVLMDAKNQYLPLPRPWTVAGLLDRYLNRKAVHSMNHSLRRKEAQCCQSLRAVFEASLGIALLMPIERYQHFELVKSGVTQGQWGMHYGVEHFLRMICVMPQWGTQIKCTCNFIDKDYGRILERLFKFVLDNEEEALPDDANFASQDYLRLCTFAGM
eukprot:m.24501 g.24501  ORF g.24501 m.24501 type:complete len:328 (+) comp11520_c0_seq1:170-1153(+)